MIKIIEAFLQKHDSFIITTHDPADADGLGAQMVLACILRKYGKQFRIINASPIPDNFRFMDPKGITEHWDEEKHKELPEKSAVFLIDTAEENHLGDIKPAVLRSREVFIFDHHEPNPGCPFSGINDPAAASTCEMAVEAAEEAGVLIAPQAAFAAYTGIIFDTGSFAYSKTSPRTFRAAITLVEAGVNPHEAYRKLCENSPAGALLLQTRAFSGMAFHCRGRVASQVLRKEDFAETGTVSDDTEGFVNVPLKSREILVSFLIKESKEGKAKCSLRSKGSINVAEVARSFGGGGHVNASGFKSKTDVDKTLAAVLERISEILEAP
jgi:phosphoesterase RecJ-like protein